MTLSEAMSRDVLRGLGSTCRRQGLDALAHRLAELLRLVESERGALEVALAGFEGPAGPVGRSAAQLLALGGKRLRPLCVLLAARTGGGFDDRAFELAVAVELVHGATLLHDDVVDVGDLRRGQPAARVVYGNAASIFAGDWLLVEALRRVRRTGIDGVLEALLDAIEEMIDAESIQLDRRGRIEPDRETWLRIARGKTGSLFRWAAEAGGRAGGLPDEACRALGAYGLSLGVAFQAVDDALDLGGDAAATGKSLLADVFEGKMTFPLALALEREPGAGEALESALRTRDEAAAARVLGAVERTGALDSTLRYARAEAERAIACLDAIRPGPYRDALAAAAWAAVDRGA